MEFASEVIDETIQNKVNELNIKYRNLKIYFEW